MADKLQRVGLVFKADGSVDFNKSLKEITASIQENRSAFELVKSTWDDSTKTAEKLKETQKYLSEQTKDYSDKVTLLSRQLDELEAAENRDERAIQNKRNQLNQAKKSLNNYKKGLDEVEDKLKSGSARMNDYAKKLDNVGNKAKSAGEKMSGISAAAAGIIGAVAATVPATEEYRKIMGSLEVSSELSGYSAEETKRIYQTLFGVLGDDQTAATTTANLQALGLSQQQLTQLVNGTIGAWAKYGDSIPIDGLAESINETARRAEVTGTFADVLNWAGTSEDAFNEKLANCRTESEGNSGSDYYADYSDCGRAFRKIQCTSTKHTEDHRSDSPLDCGDRTRADGNWINDKRGRKLDEGIRKAKSCDQSGLGCNKRKSYFQSDNADQCVSGRSCDFV